MKATKKKAKPSAPNYLEQYWLAIDSGQIRSCKKVRKAYQMVYNQSKLSDAEYYFDPAEGNRPIKFIETFCKQSKGVLGAPIRLELFQKAYIQVLYGFRWKATGFRRFKEGMLVVGRKNGKSTLNAGVSLYMLIGDREGSPEVYSVATKKDQAKIVFREACNMASQSPEIKKMLRKRKTDLYCAYNFGIMEPLCSDSDTLDGMNVSFCVIDEAHAIKDRSLYDVVKQGTTAREQPMLSMITTAPTIQKPSSLYEDQYTYAEKVISGEVIDDTFFPVIYELDNPDDWDKEEAWIEANPGLGTIKKLQTLREFVAKAKADNAFKQTVLAKDFNVKTTGSSSWLTWEDLWNPATFMPEMVADCYGIGGCDLSATTDLTCSTMLVKRPQDSIIYVLQHYFIPEARVRQIEGQSTKEAPYRKWAERGLLTICEGSRVDFHDVTKWFIHCRDDLGITMLWCGYDRALAGYWADEMAEEFGPGTMEKIAQGPFTWSQPMKMMAGMLAEKKFNYNANPVTAWCLSNTAVKTTGSLENIQPVKIQATRRIDGTVSLLNAWTCLLNHESDFNNLVDG